MAVRPLATLSSPPRNLLIATLLLVSLSPWSSAEDYDFQNAEPLLPLVRNYLNLNLCANVAYNYDFNRGLGERYQEAAVKLQEGAITSGWSSDDFAAAMVLAFEEKEGMATRDGDTPERFNRRHYSGAFCEEQLAQIGKHLHE